jgi:hypothetical protein
MKTPLRTKDDITRHLVLEYKPKAILLAGSRAQGLGSEGSDWDIYVYADKDYQSRYVMWMGYRLDLTIREWKSVAGSPLTNPYGPLFPVVILYDATHGVLDSMLRKTQAIHNKGPRKAYPIGCAERREKLLRWVEKLAKHEASPEMSLYYSGIAFEALVRVWFEERNLWPLPPTQAFAFIARKDRSYSRLLSKFATATEADRPKLAAKLTSQVTKESAPVRASRR